jgi:hypothetical protein
MVVVLAGCQAAERAGPPATEVAEPLHSEPAEWDSGPFMTAREARMRLVNAPMVSDRLAWREVRLLAALYRAAYEMRPEGMSRHVLLDAPAGRLEVHMPGRELALRVLAELTDLVSVAWNPSRDTAPGEAIRFPGTREPASRLSVRILERNDNLATVRAMIGAAAPEGGTSRMVTATWDGEQWRIAPHRVRIVW